MEKLKMVNWFDDRFYSVMMDKKKIDKVQKWISSIKPDYALTVLDNLIYLPSVTSILSTAPKEWLGRWRGQVGNWEADRIMNDAMNKGSRIHNAVSEMLRGVIIILNSTKMPEYSAEQINNIAQESNKGVLILSEQQEMLEVWRLKKFFDIVKPKVIASEMTVYSETYGYAGTLDMLWYIEAGKYDLGDKVFFEVAESGNYVLDLKTGGEDDANYPEQLSAYCRAVTECDVECKGAMIVYTNSKTKKGIEGLKIEQFNLDELRYHFDGFINQYKIWIKKAPKQPKIFDLPTVLRLN